MKKVLTDQDFIENPELTAMGLKPGDEAELPEPGLKEPVEENEQKADKNAAADSSGFEPGSDEDTGGGAPPTNKPRG